MANCLPKILNKRSVRFVYTLTKHNTLRNIKPAAKASDTRANIDGRQC